MSSLFTVVADNLYSDLGLEKVLITVRHPKTGEIIQLERDRHTPGLRLSRGYAMITEPIRLEDGRQIGQIELHSASSLLKPCQLLHLASCLQDQIALELAA